MINLAQIGKRERFPSREGNLFHVINIILPVLVQFRVCQHLQQKVADLLSQFYINYLIIFITVSIYPPTRNSWEGPLLR